MRSAQGTPNVPPMKFVQIIGKPLNIGRKIVEIVMNIFTKVNTSRAHMREQFFQGDELLFRKVPSIVDDDIDKGCGLLHVRPERPIGLVTDENLCPLVFKGATRLMDIPPVDFSVLSKILFPHQKTAAAVNTDLQHVDLSTDESVKVSLIDIEIVSPLPNSRSFLVRLEIRRHLIRRHRILIRQLRSIGESCLSSELHAPNGRRQRNCSADSQLWTCHHAAEKPFHSLDCLL